MSFNIGDRVLVIDGHDSIRNREGTIGGFTSDGKVNVYIDGVRNQNTFHGYFCFDPGSLKHLCTIRGVNIKDVIFNPPATIVLWEDGTKTVVKCGENDSYDPEKGLAMCISKKVLGNKSNYYNTFAKYLPENGFAQYTNFIFTEEDLENLVNDRIVTLDDNGEIIRFMSEKCHDVIYNFHCFVKNGV